MTEEYYIRRIAFPNSAVKAATFPNDDGTYDIYVNARLSESEQQKAIEHELRHIRLGHFRSDAPIEQKEAEADGLEVPVSEPKHTVPLFSSPAALADWLLQT